MPAAPSVATYSSAAIVDANTSFLALVDAGAGAAYVDVLSAATIVLARIALTDPAGSVNGTTGRLTLTAAASVLAQNTGIASHVEIYNFYNVLLLAIPAEEGSVAVVGKAVLNTLSIVDGGPVSLLSLILT